MLAQVGEFSFVLERAGREACGSAKAAAISSMPATPEALSTAPLQTSSTGPDPAQSLPRWS